MRSIVDLPQPDGPTSTKKAPAGACRLTSFTASTAPKRLLSLSIVITLRRAPQAASQGCAFACSLWAIRGRRDGDDKDHHGDGVGELPKALRGVAIGEHGEHGRGGR